MGIQGGQNPKAQAICRQAVHRVPIRDSLLQRQGSRFHIQGQSIGGRSRQLPCSQRDKGGFHQAQFFRGQTCHSNACRVAQARNLIHDACPDRICKEDACPAAIFRLSIPDSRRSSSIDRRLLSMAQPIRRLYKGAFRRDTVHYQTRRSRRSKLRHSIS